MELAGSLILLVSATQPSGKCPSNREPRSVLRGVIRHRLFSTRAKICPLPTGCSPSNPHDTDWTR